MAKLKTYTLADSAGYLYVHFSNPRINEVTGEPSHVNQWNLLVTASTKAEALASVEAIGKPHARENSLRVADSDPFVEALREAGYLSEGRIIVTATLPRLGDPVASLRPGPSPFEPIVESLPGPASRTEANSK